LKCSFLELPFEEKVKEELKHLRYTYMKRRAETLEIHLYARRCIDNSVTPIKLLSNKSFAFSQRYKSQHTQAKKKKKKRLCIIYKKEKTYLHDKHHGEKTSSHKC
jgi:hypothetical protein